MVDNAIKEKRKCYRAWKAGGSRVAYNDAKRVSNRAVFHAKNEAQKAALDDIDFKSPDIFRLAKQLKNDKLDVVGEKPVKNDEGVLSLDDKSKKSAWKEHYERLLNVEFDWSPDDLSEEEPVEGPSEPITDELIAKAVAKMPIGKAAGQSGIIAELIKPTGEFGVSLIRQLIEVIISEGKIPSDWRESYIISLYKGKCDALDRGNYRGLKLIEHVLKVLERVVESLIRKRVEINDMQFGFMPGRGTTDAIFILRQLQEKHMAANKTLYMAFVDLEKAFDRVPRNVIWWAMRKLGIEEWLVKVVQSMYENVSSRVRVGKGYSDAFEVKVGVHQGSVLSPLLFIIVMEALSREFHTDHPWELLYADDLVIIAKSVEELLEKLNKWKAAIEKRGLRVNMGKTKVVVSGHNLNVLNKSGKFPCGVCLTGVGANSIYCSGCSLWVHKRCSGLPGVLKEDRKYRCPRCQGTARRIDGRPIIELQLGKDKLEVVPEFCYLGDMTSACGGCDLAVIMRCKCAWGKFRQLLSLLTNRHIPLVVRGYVYSASVRSVMLYGAETWATTADTMSRLRRNDRAMLRWMCNVKLNDKVSSGSILSKLGLQDIETIVRTNRLRWFGHVERSAGWINHVRNLEVQSQQKRPGRPKLTWNDGVMRDKQLLGMTTCDPQNRSSWRGRLRQHRLASPSVEED